MFDLIRRLIEKGHAYAAGGDVYFDVRSKADYGKLSGRNLDEVRKSEREMAGDKANVGEAKRDPLDFALWKGAKPGEPAWESPWGPGRPGWHIECSAMSMKYLGETFDIHGGGQDLIFPHHENEIAQSEGATGKPFANFWTENGMVTTGGDKISKSTGTGSLFYVDEIAARTDPEVVRYYLLSTHYRSPIEFNEERLAEAAVAHQRLRGGAGAGRGLGSASRRRAGRDAGRGGGRVRPALRRGHGRRLQQRRGHRAAVASCPRGSTGPWRRATPGRPAAARSLLETGAGARPLLAGAGRRVLAARGPGAGRGAGAGPPGRGTGPGPTPCASGCWRSSAWCWRTSRGSRPGSSAASPRSKGRPGDPRPALPVPAEPAPAAARFPLPK